MKQIKTPLKIILIGLLLLAVDMSLFSQEPNLNSTFYLDSQGEGQISVSYELPEGYHQILNRDFFNFALLGEDFTLSPISYPPTISYADFDGYEGIVTLEAKLSYTGSTPPDLVEVIPLKIKYQICDEKGVCFRPMTKEVSSARITLPMESAESTAPSGVALFLLFAFMGGIILNIMPCVLPVLSLKALHLVEQSNEDNRKILINSLSYSGGILFSMMILGGLVISIKASGALLGWGFQFQNPPFVLILTSIVFLFALSLFEVFFINSPQGAGKVAQKQSGKGYAGSFITGIMAVLLATPCTAPLLGSALGFAFAQDGPIILLFFALIGLGLALPFILLGFFPRLIKKLPKPGEWMNRFREVMGFLLLGTVIYLLTTLHSQLGSQFRGILWFLLTLGFSAWLYGRAQRSRKVKKYILIGLALLGTIFGIVNFVDLTPQDKTVLSHGQDVVFSPQAVEEYREQGIPLFLEFTADWCATCRSNHITVLDRDVRVELFKELNITYMVGDYTLDDPEIGQWLKDNNRAGVPLYMFYPPKKEPVILPEIITFSLLENAIREGMGR